MEHGQKMPIQDFLSAIPDLEQVDTCLLDLDTIPTRIDIEEIYRKAPVRKAMGLDGLPSEIFKAAPKEMTNLYYGLYLRSVCCSPERPYSGQVEFSKKRTSSMAALPVQTHTGLCTWRVNLGRCCRKH